MRCSSSCSLKSYLILLCESDVTFYYMYKRYDVQYLLLLDLRSLWMIGTNAWLCR